MPGRAGERPAAVLVVDDDADVRGILRYILEDEGYDVQEVVDGPSAKVAISEHAPALVVLDLAMPGVSGFDILRERQRDGLAADMKVLVLTGRTDPGSLDRAFDLGADEVLVKPFDPEVLTGKIKALLSGDTSSADAAQAASLLHDLDDALGDEG